MCAPPCMDEQREINIYKGEEDRRLPIASTWPRSQKIKKETNNSPFLAESPMVPIHSVEQSSASA